MIAYLKGKIKVKTDKYLILEANNIGYRIFLPENILESLIRNDEEREFYIHHYLSEDRSDLYGFLKLEDLEFFELLISISGVGPKSALGIMSEADVRALKKAILSEDPSIFTKVSGVGKKTAERILIELSNKVSDQGLGGSTIQDDLEALDALVGLGYKGYEAKEILKKAPKELLAAEERVRWALRYLGR